MRNLRPAESVLKRAKTDVLALFCFVFSLNDSRLPLKRAKPYRLPNKEASETRICCVAECEGSAPLSERPQFPQHRIGKDILAQPLPRRLIWPDTDRRAATTSDAVFCEMVPVSTTTRPAS